MSDVIQDFDNPTQFKINKVDISGIPVIGKFVGIHLWENIYSPIITGSIALVDTDGDNFVEKEGIEGFEEIEFEFFNALDEKLTFKGFLNGIRNRDVQIRKVLYTLDFYTEQVINNEMDFVTKRFKDMPPEEVAQEMIERMGGKVDKMMGNGLPMNFLGTRKRPTEIIKYVMTHGVEHKSKVKSVDKQREGETLGTTGFLCWETLDGYRFSSINNVLSGQAGKNVGEFTSRLANMNHDMKTAMNMIIHYDFKYIGDVQSKLRSGAFKNVFVSLDIDKGLYQEMFYTDEHNMTEKQKKMAKQASRYMTRVMNNERFTLDCVYTQPHVMDQIKKFLAQNNVRQNTFDNESGTLILPPRFEIRAGDTIDVKIPKIESERPGGYDEKHSGRYVIKQVGHHIDTSGDAHTRIKILRSTIQKDDKSSTKS